jgi:hypothetical protein
VVHASNPSFLEDGDRRIASSRPVLANLVRPYIKNKMQVKGLGDIAQVVEGLPSMRGLRFNLQYWKKKKVTCLYLVSIGEEKGIIQVEPELYHVLEIHYLHSFKNSCLVSMELHSRAGKRRKMFHSKTSACSRDDRENTSCPCVRFLVEVFCVCWGFREDYEYSTFL